jgi:glycosyltransferase involved in cell wall biosynthesis
MVIDKVPEIERPAGATGRLGRLALVCNRFGSGAAGGAETMMAELGGGLRERGWDVDILTSTARDMYTWGKDLPEGDSVEMGLRVLRFDAVAGHRADRRRLDGLISAGAAVSVPDQYRWMNAGARVPRMHEYLFDHRTDYRAIVLAPYLSWTTFACAEITPQSTILLPCLHDEPHAQLELFRHVFHGSRGIWFQSEPEQELAQRIFDLPPRQSLIGSGIHPPAAYDPDGFRRRHSIDDDFIFYAGRHESGKGWPELVALVSFANSQLAKPIALVTCGVGDVGRSRTNCRIVDLGYITDEERSNAMAAATVYVQPSGLESFSRTIMEAWLAGTVVLGNAASSVVSWHCGRSDGGVLYHDRYDFAEALGLLLERPELREEMALSGREYVLANSLWPDVLDRVEHSLEEWT